MKILSKIKILILLTLTIGYATNTWTMSGSGQEVGGNTLKHRKVGAGLIAESKSNEQDSLDALIVPERKQLEPILYEQLDPMPMELIKIILTYLQNEFEGKQIKCIKIPAQKKSLSDNSIQFLAAISEKMLALGLSYTIIIVDPETGAFLRKIEFDSKLSSLIALATSIASGHAHGTINLWDATTGKYEQTIQASNCAVIRLTKLPFNQLAAVSHDSKINVYDIKSGACTQSFECFGCLALTELPGQNILAASSMDNGINVWDLKKKSGKRTQLKQDCVEYLIPLTKDLLIAAKKPDRDESDPLWKVTIWNVAQMKRLKEFFIGIKKNTLVDLGVIHNYQLIATMENGRSYCFDLRTGKLVKKFKYHEPQHVLCSIPLGNGHIAQALKDSVTILE